MITLVCFLRIYETFIVWIGIRVWHMIVDEGLIPEMGAWSILLIISNFNMSYPSKQKSLVAFSVTVVDHESPDNTCIAKFNCQIWLILNVWKISRFTYNFFMCKWIEIANMWVLYIFTFFLMYFSGVFLCGFTCHISAQFWLGQG